MIDNVAEENAASYVLGLLPAEETARFEALLSRDGELRALVRELRESTAMLALAGEQFAPPPRVPEAILHPVRVTKPGHRIIPPWIPWAIAAGLAVLTTVAFFERQSLMRSLADARWKGDFSKLRTAALSPQGGYVPNSVGAVTWCPGHQRGVVTISKLPPLEPNQDYQMWVIDPDHKEPISGGIVQVDENGTAKLVFTVAVPIRSADAFAVSRERKGGAPTPDGPIVLMGR
jgi:anti-sigma-K factor RskA